MDSLVFFFSSERRFLLVLLHRFEHVLTSSHTRSHFFRQVKSRWQTTHVLTGTCFPRSNITLSPLFKAFLTANRSAISCTGERCVYSTICVAVRVVYVFVRTKSFSESTQTYNNNIHLLCIYYYYNTIENLIIIFLK